MVADRYILDSLVDQRLPLTQLLLVGFQHVLLMYGGAAAASLIIDQVASLSREEVALLINANLLVTGIAILVQPLSIGPTGIRMPVMMSASFVAVDSMVAMAGMSDAGITGIFGVTIAAGFLGVLIALFIPHTVRFFPPLVTGTVTTSIGMCLLPVMISWADGSKGAEDFDSLHFLFLSSLMLCTILPINRFMRGFWINISVLIGVDLGYAIAGGMGMVDFGGLAERPWFDIITPLHFGAPTLDLAPILSMYLMVAITFAGPTGMFLALGEVAGCEITPTELRRGPLCDADTPLFAGLLSTFTHSLFAQNIGPVQMIGVRSHYVTVITAGFLILLSMLPRAAFLVTSIPSAILGDAGIAIFGVVAVSGIQILHEANITDYRSQLLVMVSINMGVVPVVHPSFFACLPVWMKPIAHSSAVMTVTQAVVLNLLSSALGRNDHSRLCNSRAPAPKYP